MFRGEHALLRVALLLVRSRFGRIDARKVRSSMTLFEAAAEGDARWKAFGAVLNKYYEGKRDRATLDILAKQAE